MKRATPPDTGMRRPGGHHAVDTTRETSPHRVNTTAAIPRHILPWSSFGTQPSLSSCLNIQSSDLHRVYTPRERRHRTYMMSTVVSVKSSRPRSVSEDIRTTVCREVGIAPGDPTVTRLHASLLEKAREMTRVVPEVCLSVRSPVVCRGCKNDDLRMFVSDRKAGTLCCTSCGAIAMDHRLNESEDLRTFADSPESRSHAQRGASTLFSSGFSLSTKVVASESSRDSVVKRLREAQRDDAGRGDCSLDVRTTHVAYKDRQKQGTFKTIDNVTTHLGLGSATADVAKMLFSWVRDQAERLRNLQHVVAVCIIASHEVQPHPPRGVNSRRDPKVHRDDVRDARDERRRRKRLKATLPGLFPIPDAPRQMKRVKVTR